MTNLDRLLTLAISHGGNLRPLRAAVEGLPAGELRDLLSAAVLRLASYEAANELRDATQPVTRATGGLGDDLPEDPFADDRAPYTAMLDRARTLRLALLDMPDVPSLLAALGAVDGDEAQLIVIEYTLDALLHRGAGEGPGG